MCPLIEPAPDAFANPCETCSKEHCKLSKNQQFEISIWADCKPCLVNWLMALGNVGLHYTYPQDKEAALQAADSAAHSKDQHAEPCVTQDSAVDANLSMLAEAESFDSGASRDGDSGNQPLLNGSIYSELSKSNNRPEVVSIVLHATCSYTCSSVVTWPLYACKQSLLHSQPQFDKFTETHCCCTQSLDCFQLQDTLYGITVHCLTTNVCNPLSQLPWHELMQPCGAPCTHVYAMTGPAVLSNLQLAMAVTSVACRRCSSWQPRADDMSCSSNMTILCLHGVLLLHRSHCV